MVRALPILLPARINLGPMNKLDLARRVARKWHRSRGQAADDVDTLVYEILKDLKKAARQPLPKREEQLPAVPAVASKDKT